MKKVYLPIFILTVVVITVGIWMFQSGNNPEPVSKVPEVFHVVLIATLILFGIVLAIRRTKSIQQGLPIEDELSKRIRQKAAAWSYYASIYVWVFALYLFHESELEGNVIIGGGVLVMALLFGVFNLIFSKVGKYHE